jgi:phenylacetic acid degradation operon negative regulatory protein
VLLWSAEQLTRPSFRNLTDSYESWAYRHGFLRQIAALEEQRLIERRNESTDGRVYRLTAHGRLHALGGRDPHAEWSRGWDGHWRLVLFDLPTSHNAQRTRLRRYLRQKGFGYLQDSVWITPNALTDEILLLRGARINVEALILLEAQPCAGESDAEIVKGAWDFDRINQLYARQIKVLNEKPSGKLAKSGDARALRHWAWAERKAWLEAVSSDPLLPRQLLPPTYLGERAWQRRIKVLGKAKGDLETFR